MSTKILCQVFHMLFVYISSQSKEPPFLHGHHFFSFADEISKVKKLASNHAAS